MYKKNNVVGCNVLIGAVVIVEQHANPLGCQGSRNTPIKDKERDDKYIFSCHFSVFLKVFPDNLKAIKIVILISLLFAGGNGGRD